MATALLDDELWRLIEPLLPARRRRFYHPGRKRLDDRCTLSGILFVLRTGIAWQHLPLGLTTAPPGSAEGGLVVSDIEAAHAELVRRGIEVSEIWHGPPFQVEARQPGPDPERTSYGSFFSFADPDGNTWLAQEVTTRLAGRMNGAETGYASAADLQSALRRAEAAHQQSGQNADWSSWYAAYMVAEQAGTDLPT